MKGRIESLAVIPGLCGIKKRLCISSQQSMGRGDFPLQEPGPLVKMEGTRNKTFHKKI